MRFIAAIDTQIYDVPYHQNDVVDTSSWTRKQVLQFLAKGLIAPADLNAESLGDALANASLSELGDVVDTPATLGQVLVRTAAGWAPGTPASTLDSLTDVDTSTTAPADKQALVFDKASNLWKPGSVASGGGGGGAALYGPVWPIDGAPLAPTSYDDEFEGTTLSSKWELVGAGASPTAVVKNGMLLFTAQGTSGWKPQVIAQPVPTSGDWEFTAALAGVDSVTGNYYAPAMIGLASGTTGATGDTMVMMLAEYGAVGRIEIGRVNTWSSWQGTTAVKDGMHFRSGYLRVKKVGTTFSWYYSQTGKSWSLMYSGTIPFTPTRVMIGGKTEADLGMNPVSRWKWFRRSDGWLSPEGDGQAVAASGGSSSGSTTAAAILPLDIPPVTPHAKDDEFVTSGLDPKWSLGFNATSTTVKDGWLTITPSVANRHAYYVKQPAPAGAFSVAAKIASPYGYALDDGRPGIMVCQGAKALIWGLALSGGPTKAMWIEHSNASDTADWGGYNGSWSNNQGGPYGGGPVWFRIRWVPASGTLFLDWSADGVRWFNWGSRTGWTQPDKIGLCMENNTGNAVLGAEFTIDWFRVTEP